MTKPLIVTSVCTATFEVHPKSHEITQGCELHMCRDGCVRRMGEGYRGKAPFVGVAYTHVVTGIYPGKPSRMMVDVATNVPRGYAVEFRDVPRVESPRLRAYRLAEEAMAMLDDAGDGAFADALRDGLDPLWGSLTTEEREALDARGVLR